MPSVSLDYEALASSDLIVAPVFINENHWTVVLIPNITSTVSYINLMGNSDDASGSILAKRKTFCLKTNHLKPVP